MSELPFKGEDWLADACVRRTTKRNQNAIVGFVGATGTGKSYSAARLGELCDPGFSADRIVFDPADLIKLIMADLPKGSVVMLDDAGVRAGARDWRKELNRALSAVFQSFRFLNLIILITVPYDYMTDKHVRTLMHYLIETTGDIDMARGICYCKPFIYEYRRGDEPRAVYPVFHVTGAGTGRLRQIGFGLPSASLIESYESKKQGWLKTFYSQLDESLSPASKKTVDSIPPSIVKVAPIISCAVCDTTYTRKDVYARHLKSKVHRLKSNGANATAIKSLGGSYNPSNTGISPGPPPATKASGASNGSDS